MTAKTDVLSDPRVKSRAFYPSWIQERVRWSDTDMGGHMNNLTFAAFCETGRALILRDFIASDSEPRSLLVLAEMRVKFLGEANWPAEVDTGTAVTLIGTRSCQWVQGLFIGERCIGVSESVLVSIDPVTRKPCPLSDPIRECFSRLQPVSV